MGYLKARRGIGLLRDYTYGPPENRSINDILLFYEMKKAGLLYLLMLFVSSVHVFAVENDSLRQKEASELYRLIRYYYSKDVDSMRYYIRKAEPVFLEVGRVEDLFRVKAWNIYALTSRREDDEVLREVNALRELSREMNFPDGLDMANQALADFYIETGFMSEGISLYKEVLQGMEEREAPLHKRINIIRQILNKGGSIETRKYYLDKLKTYIDLCDRDSITELNKELPLVYIKYFYHRSYAAYYIDVKDAKQAHSHLELMKYYIKEGNLPNEVRSFMNLELAYYRLIQDYDRALALADTLLYDFRSKKQNTQILRMLVLRADILLKKGKGVEAAKTYKEYALLKDSVTSAEFYEDLAKLRNLHDMDKLKLQNKQMELEASETHSQLLLLWGGLVLLAMVCCFLGYISYSRHRYGQQLKVAKEKAEEADHLKSAFLANMNHEIRTPLNAIVGFSQVIADEEDAETRHELSNIIQSNNELLQRLIEDVLDISKIESNTLTFVLANHEMKALMKDIYSIILLRMPENVELRLDDCQPFTLYTDRSRLTQVLTNLLTNAIKHTKKGYICFGYDVTEQEIRFYVTDTGEGIPDDQLERVFDRFVKLTEWTNGVGLGLAISKALVTKLGGRIEVTSQQGVGSTFSVIFPR